MVLVISFAVIPVAGVADQAIVGMLGVTLAVGILTGVLVSALSNAFFPDPSDPAAKRPSPPPPSREAAGWIALRSTLIVMPVFVLALTDPSFYLAAIMKTVTLSQQAGETDARSAGRELVGSTLLWAGSGIFRVRPTSFRPSFWSNALVTMLILIGPAIEDSASGKGVFEASAVRTCLFVGVALYAWGTVWVLERWRGSRLRAMSFVREGNWRKS
jgi:hypothetical protein